MSTLKTNNVQVGQSVTATNNFTIYQPSTPDGTVRIGVGNSGATTADVLTANSSGNVGIGTSSPEVISNFRNVQSQGATTTSGGLFTCTNSDSSIKARFYVDGTQSVFGAVTNHPQTFITNGTDRGRFDSSGNFMVGRSDTGFTSGQPGMLVLPTQGITFTKTNSPNLGACMYLHRTFGAGTGNLVEFAYDTVVRGWISTNGTGVTYATSSDYRLKHDIQPMTGALAKVAQLKPVTYRWNADNSESQGFIAHELQAVVPDCVTGEKDAVDADGNPVYQGIDTSFLVATLTAGLQEAVAMIEELKAKVAALEAE